MDNRKIVEEILETLKTKVKPEKWDTWNDYQNIRFYFSRKDGDIKDFIALEYAGIEIKCHQNSTSGDISTNDIFKTFNIYAWLEAIKEHIEDGNITHEETDFYTDKQVVEITKEVMVENQEHKTKAEMLDRLLSSKNLTN
jgi:hypothetical protein